MFDKIIKHCPCCSAPFTAKEILDSNAVIPIGMMVDFDDPKLAFYYFNHNTNTCKSTFTIPVAEFDAYINPDKNLKIQTNKNGCGGYCLEVEDESTCYNNCRWAQYRLFIAKLMENKRVFTV